MLRLRLVACAALVALIVVAGLALESPANADHETTPADSTWIPGNWTQRSNVTRYTPSASGWTTSDPSGAQPAGFDHIWHTNHWICRSEFTSVVVPGLGTQQVAGCRWQNGTVSEDSELDSGCAAMGCGGHAYPAGGDASVWGWLGHRDRWEAFVYVCVADGASTTHHVPNTAAAAELGAHCGHWRPDPTTTTVPGSTTTTVPGSTTTTTSTTQPPPVLPPTEVVVWPGCVDFGVVANGIVPRDDVVYLQVGDVETVYMRANDGAETTAHCTQWHDCWQTNSNGSVTSCGSVLRPSFTDGVWSCGNAVIRHELHGLGALFLNSGDTNSASHLAPAYVACDEYSVTDVVDSVSLADPVATHRRPGRALPITDIPDYLADDAASLGVSGFYGGTDEPWGAVEVTAHREGSHVFYYCAGSYVRCEEDPERTMITVVVLPAGWVDAFIRPPDVFREYKIVGNVHDDATAAASQTFCIGEGERYSLGPRGRVYERTVGGGDRRVLPIWMHAMGAYYVDYGRSVVPCQFWRGRRVYLGQSCSERLVPGLPPVVVCQLRFADSYVLKAATRAVPLGAGPSTATVAFYAVDGGLVVEMPCSALYGLCSHYFDAGVGRWDSPTDLRGGLSADVAEYVPSNEPCISPRRSSSLPAIDRSCVTLDPSHFDHVTVGKYGRQVLVSFGVDTQDMTLTVPYCYSWRSDRACTDAEPHCVRFTFPGAPNEDLPLNAAGDRCADAVATLTVVFGASRVVENLDAVCAPNADGDMVVDASWDPHDDATGGYRVSATGGWRSITTTEWSTTATEYSWAGTPGGLYSVQVRIVTADGPDPVSAEASVTCPPEPPDVTITCASHGQQGTGDVTLTWPSAAGADHYEIASQHSMGAYRVFTDLSVTFPGRRVSGPAGTVSEMVRSVRWHDTNDNGRVDQATGGRPADDEFVRSAWVAAETTCPLPLPPPQEVTVACTPVGVRGELSASWTYSRSGSWDPDVPEPSHFSVVAELRNGGERLAFTVAHNEIGAVAPGRTVTRTYTSPGWSAGRSDLWDVTVQAHGETPDGPAASQGLVVTGEGADCDSVRIRPALNPRIVCARIPGGGFELVVAWEWTRDSAWIDLVEPTHFAVLAVERNGGPADAVALPTVAHDEIGPVFGDPVSRYYLSDTWSASGGEEWAVRVWAWGNTPDGPVRSAPATSGLFSVDDDCPHPPPPPVCPVTLLASVRQGGVRLTHSTYPHDQLLTNVPPGAAPGIEAGGLIATQGQPLSVADAVIGVICGDGGTFGPPSIVRIAPYCAFRPGDAETTDPDYTVLEEAYNAMSGTEKDRVCPAAQPPACTGDDCATWWQGSPPPGVPACVGAAGCANWRTPHSGAYTVTIEIVYTPATPPTEPGDPPPPPPVPQTITITDLVFTMVYHVIGRS